MNHRSALLAGSLCAGLGVALGAFGAHSLKPILLAHQRVDVYETAVKYLLYHSFALLIIGMVMKQWGEDPRWSWAARSWLIGIIFFCGSLFALCFVEVGMFALFTPLGGLFFLAGWGLLAFAIAQKK